MIIFITIIAEWKMQLNEEKYRHILKSLMLIFRDNDNAYASLKKDFLSLWKMIDGYKTEII